MSAVWPISRPPISSSRIHGPTSGVDATMFMLTVIAQNASWSHGSR